jgi:hypothetical protein
MRCCRSSSRAQVLTRLHVCLSVCMSQVLSEQFPASDWVVWQAATAQYNLRNFDEAEALFEDLGRRDPFRLEVRGAAPTPQARARSRLPSDCFRPPPRCNLRPPAPGRRPAARWEPRHLRSWRGAVGKRTPCRPSVAGTRLLCMAAKHGPDVLFVTPNVANCVAVGFGDDGRSADAAPRPACQLACLPAMVAPLVIRSCL